MVSCSSWGMMQDAEFPFPVLSAARALLVVDARMIGWHEANRVLPLCSNLKIDFEQLDMDSKHGSVWEAPLAPSLLCTMPRVSVLSARAGGLRTSHMHVACSLTQVIP